MYEYVYCRLSRKDRSFQISLNLSRELDLTAIYLVVVYNCRKSNKRPSYDQGNIKTPTSIYVPFNGHYYKVMRNRCSFCIQRTK